MKTGRRIKQKKEIKSVQIIKMELKERQSNEEYN